MLCEGYWLPTAFASFPFTSPPVRHRVPSHFNWSLQKYYVWDFLKICDINMSYDISLTAQFRLLTGTLNFFLFLKRPYRFWWQPISFGHGNRTEATKEDPQLLSMQVLQRANYTGVPCKTSGPAFALSYWVTFTVTWQESIPIYERVVPVPANNGGRVWGGGTVIACNGGQVRC
jgi:hypothetical protein